MLSMTLEQLRATASAGGILGATLRARGGEFVVEVETASGRNAVLAKARSSEPRQFGNPASAIGVLRGLGIVVMKLDATDWNPESKRTTRGRPARAGAFGSELKQKTLVLADQPGLGRTGRPGMPTGVRELVVHPNYIIIHRVREAERTVEILRVKHASRQVP